MLLRPTPLIRAPYQIGRPHTVPAVRLQKTSLAFQYARRHVNGFGGPLPNQVEPQSDDVEETSRAERNISRPQWSATLFKMFESAATTSASLLILGLAGYAYHKYYKYLILKKMAKAFEPGDPVLELAALGKGLANNILQGDEQHWIRYTEQTKIDAIMNGTDRGHYHLLIGEKGTGKSSMLLHAMQKVDGEGISMLEAHADLEIFRIRLGKALDYEFHEDYIGSLFSIKGPRDGNTALLDIERALNKLEKLALIRRKTVGKPLVLIINSTHLLRDDDDGRDLLELIQQRAEQWAASNLVTVILNSDDYWVYERLKRYSTRMEVLPVLDLPRDQAISALKQFRKRYYKEEEQPSSDLLEEVYSRLGGRLTFLNRVAKSPDMLRTCEEICQVEKTWFLNNCWILGDGCDDDVMDQQKYASAAMVLAKALVDQEHESGVSNDKPYLLPQIPLHKAREIMTRADFIKSYDHINIFTIDAQAMVRADSVPMQRAFRQICSEPGFEKHLEATLNRISAIESLGRTREVVAKDLIAGKYKISGRLDRGEAITLEVCPTGKAGG
ncbi:hypothetical protein N7G274_004187 [Stereocaulon virgatum]|uniref:Orc1-like AAA ATPase domain-containing protein n=1 Tax=Stereocaulon virgatum TaxID=373712 RepID=A0ABR4AEW3_9LECA